MTTRGAEVFLVRRIFKVKKGKARKAAELITQIGAMYEKAGQRTPSRVYISGGGVPGPADTVYMEWTEEALRSAYREQNPVPPGMDPVYAELRELQEETSIEFYDLYSGS
ncbi:MAG: hypothetical protein IH869_00840 [Chloroflexi bacterium]|nr:hypothetical protein [Chloroflexota bacterium]